MRPQMIFNICDSSSTNAIQFRSSHTLQLNFIQTFKRETNKRQHASKIIHHTIKIEIIRQSLSNLFTLNDLSNAIHICRVKTKPGGRTNDTWKQCSSNIAESNCNKYIGDCVQTKQCAVRICTQRLHPSDSMRNHVQYYMEISTVLSCTKCIVNDVFWSYLYLRFRLFSLELMFGHISSYEVINTFFMNIALNLPYRSVSYRSAS